jgi:hypothetical protein
LLRVEFPAENVADLAERFSADRRLELVPHGAASWAGAAEEGKPEEPPPREVFLLLDRPAPPAGAASEQISAEQIPNIIGTLAIFGRQTDRQQRVELLVMRQELPKAAEILRRAAGDALGAGQTESLLEAVPYFDNGLQWQWRIPEGVPSARRETLLHEEKRRRLLEFWPDLPDPLLDGQTPRSLSADPKNRIRLLARILLLESVDPINPDAATFNELRRRLGLPTADAIDPATIDVGAVPPVRVHRLQVDQLDDNALLAEFRRAGVLRSRRTLAKLAAEIVKRPALADRVDIAAAHGELAMAAEDAATALAEIELARAAAKRAKQSTARWDVMEFELRLRRGEGVEADRLLKRLEREHFNEPGVPEAVLQILYSAGIVDERGRPTVPPPTEQRPALVVPGAEPGKILVPGGDAAAAAGKPGGPVIWTPGMD